jgi:crossover junction endodeoxyribonuclease RuvC
MIALGIDTGLANLGWALIECKPAGQRVLGVGVITTKKSDRKRNVLASADNMRRVREQTRALLAIRAGSITFDSVDVICTESQSWPRSASSSAKIGMSWGIIGSIAEQLGLPLTEASPQQIKLAVAGSKTASKADLMAALATKPGFKARLATLLNSYPKGKHEHAVDACGAVIACQTSDVVRALIGRSE